MIHGFTKPVLFKLHRLLSIDLRGKKYVKTTVKWPTCHNNNLLHAIEMLACNYKIMNSQYMKNTANKYLKKKARTENEERAWNIQMYIKKT